MTKKEKIKEEYIALFSTTPIEEREKRFSAIEPYIDEFGWFEGDLNNVAENLIERSGYEIRPKTLIGIEDNNGWNKIEDGVFPEDEETVLWLNNENYEFENASLLHCDFDYKQYTHWRPLPKKAPLF